MLEGADPKYVRANIGRCFCSGRAFEIGLWVEMATTPNRMGRKGDTYRNSARAKTIAFQNDDRKPSLIPFDTEMDVHLGRRAEVSDQPGADAASSDK